MQLLRLELFLFVLAGALLGALFFGGLWWTVNRLPGARRPTLLVLASFGIRTAAVLAGCYLILVSGGIVVWPRFLAALGGFLMVRIAAFFLVRPAGAALGKGKGGVKDDSQPRRDRSP